MAKFGVRFKSSAYEPWEDYYINYNQLKQALWAKRQKFGQEFTMETPSPGVISERKQFFASESSFGTLVRNVSGGDFVRKVSGTVLNMMGTHDEGGQEQGGEEVENNGNRDQFRGQLDDQIERCVMFFLKRQGELADELAKLRDEQRRWKDRAGQFLNASDEDIRRVAVEYQEIGEEVLRLVKFTELNVMAIRKIVKKHDKHFIGEPLADEYLSLDAIMKKPKETIQQDKPLEQFYHFGGITALVCTLRNGLLDAAEADRQGWEMSHGLDLAEQQLYGDESSSPSSPMGNSPHRSLNEQEGGLDSLPFDSVHLEVEPILENLERAHARLKQASLYEERLASLSLLFFQAPASADGDEDSEEDRNREVHHVSRYLNLISAFLYMTNYYVVAPNCGAYAVTLGGSGADAALIIGMTPFAAQFGAVLYSWWANKSYKYPLMFAAICSSLGNIMYAAALPFGSFKMILAGRLLNGFGGARAINRRYIADGYRVDERTAASAAFITGSSLGMAAGPFINAIVNLVFNDEGQFLTSETAPGYIMAVAWIVYYVCVLFYFNEPEILHKRKVKKERQKLEKLCSREENQPLLIKNNDNDNNKSNKNDETLEPHDIRNNWYRTKSFRESIRSIKASSILSSMWTNAPVMTTLWVYFVLKCVLECLMSSISMLTKYYFQWHHAVVGVYMAILGLLMFPTNLLVARYSRWYQDRDLIFFFLVATTFGIIGLFYYTGEDYTVVQYVTASVVIFCATNSLEGVNLSLLSKTIPKSWASHGILNSGLLATEFGTFGRTFAASFLTWVAHRQGVDSLLDSAFGPLGIIVFLSSLLVWYLYDRLVPIDEDDEDEEE